MSQDTTRRGLFGLLAGGIASAASPPAAHKNMLKVSVGVGELRRTLGQSELREVSLAFPPNPAAIISQINAAFRDDEDAAHGEREAPSE